MLRQLATRRAPDGRRSYAAFTLADDMPDALWAGLVNQSANARLVCV
jgi:hypothetical protein